MADRPLIAVLDRFGVSGEVEETLDRLRAAGFAVRRLDWPQLSFHLDVGLVDGDGEPVGVAVALVRSRVYTRADDPSGVFDRLELLEGSGVRVVNNARSIRAAHNKVLSAAVLDRAGVPVPPTRLVGTLPQAARRLADWPETIFKPVHRHAGIGHLRMRRMAALESPGLPAALAPHQEIALWHLLRQHGEFCAQRVVPGRDVRIMVVRDEIVACYLRCELGPEPDPGGYEVDVVECTAELAAAALTACRVLGLDHAAVDLVRGGTAARDGGRFAMVEVNPSISFWSHLAKPGLYLIEHGIGAAYAAMVAAA
jgi:glutathione synthase/RimK-type ligase-like ATP-grasp enzyme